MSDCYNCKHAFVTGKPTWITTKNGNDYFQTKGGATCLDESVKSMTITDGEMVCSNFVPRAAIEG